MTIAATPQPYPAKNGNDADHTWSIPVHPPWPTKYEPLLMSWDEEPDLLCLCYPTSPGAWVRVPIHRSEHPIDPTKPAPQEAVDLSLRILHAAGYQVPGLSAKPDTVKVRVAVAIDLDDGMLAIRDTSPDSDGDQAREWAMQDCKAPLFLGYLSGEFTLLAPQEVEGSVEVSDAD